MDRNHYRIPTRAIVAVYLASAVAANLLVALLGIGWMPIVAASLIPLDLTLRDVLHERWAGDRGRLVCRLAALVAIGGVITIAANTSAFNVAVASCGAYCAAGAVDSLAYHGMRRHGMAERMIVSNTASSIVDSVTFPLLAFGGGPVDVIALNATIKVVGGLVWTLVLTWAKHWSQR